MENSAASAPVNILNAECDPCPEYMKKKNTFRLFFFKSRRYPCCFCGFSEHLLLSYLFGAALKLRPTLPREPDFLCDIHEYCVF